MYESPFAEAQHYTPREYIEYAGHRLPAAFATAAEEYTVATTQLALCDRSDRVLLRVTGKDRKKWLHNLLTNAILPLQDNQGVYAFATNVKARVLFDVNVLNLAEEVWLDLDATAQAPAATHFDRHLFTEDVHIDNLTGQTARLGVCGPKCVQLAVAVADLDLAQLAPLSSVQPTTGTWLFRHDFCGRIGFELIIPRGEAATWWDRLVGHEATPIGRETLDLLRIEAGIPWMNAELDESVLPPETGQTERAIHYQKGCYIGHEVIERMRSRGGVARRLVQLQVTNGSGLDLPAPLRRDRQTIGQITSLRRHPIQPSWVGLGYLKTSVTGFAEITAGDDGRPITVCST